MKSRDCNDINNPIFNCLETMSVPMFCAVTVAVPVGTQCYFYRTQAGAEIDLLLGIDNALWAVQIKRNLAPTVSRGFHNACEDLNPVRRIVICPGQDCYKLKEDIAVMPLGNLLNELIGKRAA